MLWSESIGVQKLLSQHSGLRIANLSSDHLELEGEYELNAKNEGGEAIHEEFSIRVVIPSKYPRELPTVYEIGNFFPRKSDFHTYEDGELCLGSEIRLKQICSNNKCISNFFSLVVDPCLYSIAHKVRFGSMPFGELDHGESGLIDDYEKLLSIRGKESVLLALKALGCGPREANKLKCPCGCGTRLGLCIFRFNLMPLRKLAKRRWFRYHLKSSFTAIPKPPKNINTKKRQKTKAKT